MNTDPKSSLTDLMTQARGMMPTDPTVAPQMERFWKAQEANLLEAEGYVQGWFQRRHEATNSALQAVRKAEGKGADASASMQTIMDWQQHSIQRMTDDVRQWVDLCSRCASRMTTAQVEAGLDLCQNEAGQGRSPSRRKHSTPV